MTKGVIILGSARGDGNTAAVVKHLQAFTGYDVVNILDYEINYYDYDHSHRDDDFIPLMEKLITNYETMVFATPVYWYSMSAQLKTFFDRISDLLRIEKEIGRKLRGKNMALLSCGHANDMVAGFEMPFVHSANYLGMNYLGDCYTWSANALPEQLVIDKIEAFADELLTAETLKKL